MLTIFLLEIFFLTVWTLVFAYVYRRNELEGLVILISSLPVVLILEIWNEVYDKGAYYPEPTYIGFPGLEIPLAIIFAGSLVVYLIHIISAEISRSLGISETYWISIIILSWICIPIEFTFLNLGFWQYDGWESYEIMVFLRDYSYLNSYSYYLGFILPPLIVNRLVSGSRIRLKPSNN